MKTFEFRSSYLTMLGLAVVILLPALVLAEEKSPVGLWQGPLEGANLRIILKVSEGVDHKFTAILKSPDQSNSEIPVNKFTFENGNLHFESKSIGAVYDGKMSDDGSKIAGNFVQGKYMPLTLKRTDKEPEVETLPELKDADSLKPYLDEVIGPVIKDKWITAMAVGVIYKGQTRVWGFGKSTLKGKKVPDGDTEFEIGSVTKLFTKLMLSDMVQKGQMKLDDPVNKYLPSGVKMASFNGKQVTLLHLAMHLSGLPHDPDDFKWNDSNDNLYANYPVKRLYDYINRFKLPREPGVKPEYSNTGVALLGHVITLKSGLAFEDYLQQLVCGPLSLKNTGVTWTEDQKSRAAQSYDSDGKTRSLWNWTSPTFAPAGSIHSTVNDLLKLAEAVFNPTAEPIRSFASGKIAEQVDWGPFVNHDGQTNGFNCSFGVDRNRKIALVVWGNAGNLKTSQVAVELRKIFDGKTPRPLDLPKLMSWPAAKLKPYVGRYVVEQGDDNYGVKAGTIEDVRIESGHLVASDKTGFDTGVYPLANGDFYVKGANYAISFYRDVKGNILGAFTRPNPMYFSFSERKLDKSGKPMVDPSAPKGVALESPGDKLLVDNFESGKTQNLLGGSSSVQFDDRKLGTEVNGLFIVKGGPKDSQYCARIFGHYGFARAPWPYVQLQTTFGNQGAVDLSGFKAIEFWAKGNGKKYAVMFSTPSVTDYCYFQVPFTASKEWTLVHVDLDSFAQPAWGQKVLRDFGAVSYLLFQPFEMNNEDFDLWIDDVTLLK